MTRHSEQLQRYSLDAPFVYLPQTSSAPSMYLRARYGIVPLLNRESELEEIDRWCDDPEPISVLVLSGLGGLGKTRLAAEACRAASIRPGPNHWISGFLAERAGNDGIRAVIELESPRLLAIDYAETRVEQITTLLAHASQVVGPASALRVLLLVRDAESPQDAVGRFRFKDDAADAILTWARHLHLDEQDWSEEQRTELGILAAQYFSARLGTPSRDLDERLGSRPLTILANSLLSCLQPSSDGLSRPLVRILAHEEAYWRRGASLAGVSFDRAVLRRSVTVATAAGSGAHSEAQAVDLLRQHVPDLRDADSASLGTLVRWLHDLYPRSGGGYLPPLEPDLLAEELLAEWIRE